MIRVFSKFLLQWIKGKRTIQNLLVVFRKFTDELKCIKFCNSLSRINPSIIGPYFHQNCLVTVAAATEVSCCELSVYT
jgi:hypothetical protein